MMRVVRVGADGDWKQALASKPRSRVMASVECPPCSRRTLQGLPRVSRGVLRGIVAANLERYFPLSGSPLVTDAAWVSAKGGTARAYALTEDISHEILELAKGAGCYVVGICPADEPKRNYSLLPRSEADRRRAADQHCIARLAFLTLGVVLTCIAVAIGGQRHLRSRAEKSQPAAELVRNATALQRELRMAARAESAFVHDRSHNQRLIAQLGTLVRSLSERDELTSVELTKLGVQELGVLSRDPGPVIAAFRLATNGPRLSASDAPTLIRRGDDVWTHVLLRTHESSK